MIKLDFEQRQRATALADDMAMTDNIDEFAFETIFLRDEIERLRAALREIRDCETLEAAKDIARKARTVPNA